MILVTGSQGFIGSYITQDLLEGFYNICGIDNYSKYGKIKRKHDNHAYFKLLVADLTHKSIVDDIVFLNPNVIICCAAMIGGIRYFHKNQYDLMATNDRIMANTLDAAKKLYEKGNLKHVIVLSSSMVYENATEFPTKEEHVCPPPSSSYGFQKLSCERMIMAANEQFRIPYTIVRPFNVVGLGEEDKEFSHVLPDFVKAAKFRKHPFPILGNGEQVRCFTHGKDLARAIRYIINDNMAINKTFNISNPKQYKIIDLAKLVWERINGTASFYPEFKSGFKYDVQYRVPDVTKAKQLLNFTARIPVEQAIEELIEDFKE